MDLSWLFVSLVSFRFLKAEFSWSIPIRRLAFRTDYRLFLLCSGNPSVPASFALETLEHYLCQCFELSPLGLFMSDAVIEIYYCKVINKRKLGEGYPRLRQRKGNS
jgi:hypothetical protein